MRGKRETLALPRGCAPFLPSHPRQFECPPSKKPTGTHVTTLGSLSTHHKKQQMRANKGGVNYPG